MQRDEYFFFNHQDHKQLDKYFVNPITKYAKKNDPTEDRTRYL